MTLHVSAQALGALGICAALLVCTLYVTKSHGTERQGGRATGCLPDLWRHNSGRLPRLEIDRCEPASDRQGRPAARLTRQRESD